MSTYEISKSSLLSLKAEILRKQQELTKAKFENEEKIKLLKKNTPLEIKNKGVEGRIRNDENEEDGDLLKLSKSALEHKAKLYDKLSSGSLTEEDKKKGKLFLVRFDKKNKSKVSDLPPSGSEDDDKASESDGDYYQSDEDNIKDPGEQFVDYIDCFGRTRRCLQKDLEYLKVKDDELRQVVEEKKKKNEQQSIIEEDPNPKDEKNAVKEKENTTNTPTESELLSSDMRREMLRQQWEAEEEQLRNKSDIHYQDVLFGEARTHGVGYYSFSKDEEERFKQQEALKKLREETEMKQKKAQELKLSREKLLAARIKAAKNRKRARMGLPPEEDDEPETPKEPEITEEEKKKQEEIKLKKEMSERLLEEARKKHLRPWDIGKEGVKEHYVMSQEEWVEKKRKERPEVFAPPSSDRKDFRSFNKDFHVQVEDADKSLRFSTKNKKERGKLAGLNPYKQSYEECQAPQDKEYNDHMIQAFDDHMIQAFDDHIVQASDDHMIQAFDDHMVQASSSRKFSHYEEIQQNRIISPEPIVDLIDSSDIRLDNTRPADSERFQHMSQESSEDSKRGRGAEIAPPLSFDYYGPSQNKIPRSTGQPNMYEESIEAGLKFLRKQVEEKEKSSKHPREMFLL